MNIDRYFGGKTKPQILSSHIKTDMIRFQDDKYVDLIAEIQLLQERIEELEYENRGICSRIQDSLSKLFSMPVMLWVQVIRPGISRMFSLRQKQEGHLRQNEAHGQDTEQNVGEEHRETIDNPTGHNEPAETRTALENLRDAHERIIRDSMIDLTVRHPANFYYSSQTITERR